MSASLCAEEITRVEIDTTHFKGNAPDTFSIQAAYVSAGTEQSIVIQSMFWRYLLPEQELQPDLSHSFDRQMTGLGVVTHVRLNVIPDGGINRTRLFGAARGP